MPAPRVPALVKPADLPAHPRQTRSLEKRRKFLEAGRVLFGRKGYDATSIEEIAAHAGAASGAFYIYFHSKRQLLLVLMDELLQRLDSLDLRPKGGPDVRIGLRTFLAEAFRTDVRYFGVVRAWQEAALADPQLGQMQAAIVRWTETRILRVFQLLQKHPSARPDRDLRTFARMMDRHFWSLLARGSQLHAREFNREVRMAADVIYYYLFETTVAGPQS